MADCKDISQGLFESDPIISGEMFLCLFERGQIASMVRVKLKIINRDFTLACFAKSEQLSRSDILKIFGGTLTLARKITSTIPRK